MKIFKVAIIGQIAKWKGQDILIKAANLVSNNTSNIEFYIIGDVLFDKEEEREYKRAIIELAKNSNNIIFLGHINNVRKVIKEMDIIVHASTREEPFGRVIIEGMAEKKPVIASCIGAPIEILEDGISGILYQPGSYKELADRIEELIMDKEKYKSIAENGYQTFIEKFDIKITVSSVEECIQSVI